MLLSFLNGFGQNRDSLNTKKIWINSSVDLLAISGTYIALNQLWYKDYPSSSMHWFDDSEEWFQMDKMGHAFSSYHLSSLYSEQMAWSGINSKKASLIGSSLSFLTISSIELLDAKSVQWGASVSDLSANFFGAALYLSQDYFWEEQKLMFKYSYHNNSLSKYRSDLLGENFAQNLIKDYNGQTYWLSVNAKSFIQKQWVPNWLNIAIGYSANGMLGARRNPFDLPYNKRERQFFLSLDIDLRKIPVKSKVLRKLFNVLNIIKFPMPTLELSSGKIKGHYLYF